MKSRVFSIPEDSIVEFAEIIGENELEGAIVGVNDDNEVEISVDYEPDEQSQAILEMIELVENLHDPD